MRTRSEIKRNNIRKANLIVESKQRTNRGNMASSFGLYNEQCGVQSNPLDTDGPYMGAPAGTEPMMGMDDSSPRGMGRGNVCPSCGQTPCACGGDSPFGQEMGGEFNMSDGPMSGGEMEGIDDDDMVMDNQMMMAFMKENKIWPVPEPGKPGPAPNNPYPDQGDAGDWMTTGGGDDEEEYMGEMDDEMDDELELRKENYKAVIATPTTDSWGNKFNHILNESSKVNGAKSLMHRMKRARR